MKMTMCAPCLFGLESVLAGEIRRIGGEEVQAADGRVTFGGDEMLLARANLWLRTAERVCIVLGGGEVRSFEDLFQLTSGLPWEDWLGRSSAFPVQGWSLKSKLHSVPDCQAIIKKAVVKRLEKAYGQSWFEETGAVHQIRFSLLKDTATLMLDTSGVGLHKRGYRPSSNEAPIKETLAAGIVDLARVRGRDLVIDPMCGSGTLLIEAALRGLNIAPGVRRHFAAEKWDALGPAAFERERAEAMAKVDRDAAFRAQGWDVDPSAVELTGQNAARAGVQQRIDCAQRDITGFTMEAERAIVLCNPPYGERMLEQRQAEALYRSMGKVLERRPGWSYYIISPHEEFEKLFGRRADKRRKLYNGMIKCQLYMYFR